jgi:hypothetical protein
LTGDRSLICVDAALGLPVRSEIYWGDELSESYNFEAVTPRMEVKADYFTPESAGL